ncbi:MAG: P27 family phage terminase small subunit [Chloroflexi bacterium]|nr:MAG: P27 family phage terminase small subunit [Chloroflexota bacterium]
MSIPKPPADFSASSKTLWRQVLEIYELSDAELVILAELGRALDRARQARAEIDRAGLTIEGRFGPRANPACAIENQAVIRASRLMRQLGLRDLDDQLAKQRYGATRPEVV